VRERSTAPPLRLSDTGKHGLAADAIHKLSDHRVASLS